MRIRCHPRWLLVVILTVNCVSFAQTAAQPAWTDITTTHVKPAMRAKYEKYLKREMAAYRKAGTPWFLTLQTFAGDTTEYTTIVPVMKFADLDRPAIPARVLGPNRWRVLAKKIARCYSSQIVVYATPLTALRISGKEQPSGLYWLETRSQPVSGKTNAYISWLRDEYRPAIEKAGVLGFNASIAVFGTAGGEIVSMRMLKNLGEIDDGSVLTRALGPDQARAVSAEGSKLVRSTSTRILHLQTDLSY